MSFAKRAAQLLTNRYEMRKFAQEVEDGIPATDLEPGVQDFLGDDRGLEEAEDDARRRRRRSWAVLGALGGIGALGGLGYYGWKNRGSIAAGIGSPDKLTTQLQADDKGLPLRHRFTAAVQDSIPGMSATEGAPSSALDRVTGGLGNEAIVGQAALRTALRSDAGTRALDHLSGDPELVDRYVRRTPGSLHGLRGALQEADPKALQEAVKDSKAPRSRTRALLNLLAGHSSERSKVHEARLRTNQKSRGLKNLNDIFREASNQNLPELSGSVRGTPQEAARALRDTTSADLDRGTEGDRLRLVNDLTALKGSVDDYDNRLKVVNRNFDSRINELKSKVREKTVSGGRRAKSGEGDTVKGLRAEIKQLESGKAQAASELDRQFAEQHRQREALARALNPEAATRPAQSNTLGQLIDVLKAPSDGPPSRLGRLMGSTGRATSRGAAPFAADRAANIGLRMFWDQQDAPDRAEQHREWERRRAQQGGGQ